jgi:hypothetical protein
MFQTTNQLGLSYRTCHFLLGSVFPVAELAFVSLVVGVMSILSQFVDFVSAVIVPTYLHLLVLFVGHIPNFT